MRMCVYVCMYVCMYSAFTSRCPLAFPIPFRECWTAASYSLTEPQRRQGCSRESVCWDLPSKCWYRRQGRPKTPPKRSCGVWVASKNMMVKKKVWDQEDNNDCTTTVTSPALEYRRRRIDKSFCRRFESWIPEVGSTLV